MFLSGLFCSLKQSEKEKRKTSHPPQILDENRKSYLLEPNQRLGTVKHLYLAPANFGICMHGPIGGKF